MHGPKASSGRSGLGAWARLRVRPDASAKATTVSCTVTGEKTDAGLKILSSALKVEAEGLQGITAADFEALAKEAEGTCPVSVALHGNLTISVDVTVK